MDFRGKNIRLHPTRYQGRGWYFVTICCEARKPVFSDSKHAIALIDRLKHVAERHHFGVRAYCVMPDHFHGLVEGLGPQSDLLLFVRNFKQVSSREYSKQNGQALWQKKFYDHILRANDSIDLVSWYIWMNPVRKGLCGKPFEYPYSGSFTGEWEKMVKPDELWAPAWRKNQVARP